MVAADAAAVTIADTWNHRVRRIDTARQTVATIAGDGRDDCVDGPALKSAIVKPCDATALPGAVDGDLLVASYDALRRFDAQSQRLTTVPLSIAGLNPCGLVATPSGWALMSCSTTHSIYAVDARDGRTERIAGTGAKGFADGPATEAAFNRPFGLELLAIGGRPTLIVADRYNHRLRAVSLPPFFVAPPASVASLQPELDALRAERDVLVAEHRAALAAADAKHAAALDAALAQANAESAAKLAAADARHVAALTEAKAAASAAAVAGADTLRAALAAADAAHATALAEATRATAESAQLRASLAAAHTDHAAALVVVAANADHRVAAMAADHRATAKAAADRLRDVEGLVVRWRDRYEAVVRVADAAAAAAAAADGGQALRAHLQALHSDSKAQRRELQELTDLTARASTATAAELQRLDAVATDVRSAVGVVGGDVKDVRAGVLAVADRVSGSDVGRSDGSGCGGGDSWTTRAAFGLCGVALTAAAVAVAANFGLFGRSAAARDGNSSARGGGGR